MCIAVFICCLETFIITTALPQITSKLEATDSDFAWVGSAYLLSYAAVIPIWARISEILGEKLVLLITSSIFLVGTVIGALSQDSAMLIAGRAVQGMGVGGLMVVINICVVLMYPPR
jgi:MFS family permease